jgi:trans-2-enoyl-CoA reductase
LPAIGGNEGVGEVLAVGGEVKGINVGDWALMANSGQGMVHVTNMFSPDTNLLELNNCIHESVCILSNSNAFFAWEHVNYFRLLDRKKSFK